MVTELIAHNGGKLALTEAQASKLTLPPLFCAPAALEATIRRLLGEAVCQYLAGPGTQELSANFEPATHQCRLFIDDGIGPMRPA